jgi:hypothetical protein
MLFAFTIALCVYAVSAQVTQPKSKTTKIETKTTTIQKGSAADHSHAGEQSPTKAVCVLKPSKGSDIEGSFMLTQQGNNTEIIGEVPAEGAEGAEAAAEGDKKEPAAAEKKEPAAKKEKE